MTVFSAMKRMRNTRLIEMMTMPLSKDGALSTQH